MPTIRPTTFEDFIGNSSAAEQLRTALISASRQGRPLQHTLLTGPAGVGKTTLAMSVVPTYLKPESATLLNCAGIDRPQEFTSVVATVPQNGLLFLDEVHRLPLMCKEHLLTVLEDRRLVVKIEDSVVNVDLPEFTVICATTRDGLLDGPLRSRFIYTIHLQEYTEEELAQISIWHARQRGWELQEQAATEVGLHAQGCARAAVNILEACIDTVVADSEDYRPEIDSKVSTRTLSRLGYSQGLTPKQQAYLAALTRLGGVASLKSLADALSESVDTVEVVYEPWLIRTDRIRRTSRGRVLSDAPRN